MRQAIPILATIVLVVVVAAVAALTPKETPPDPVSQLRARYSGSHEPSVDHSRFPQLQKAFKKPQEVTEACIGCHNGRHIEVMNSNHWNWEREEYIQGRGVVYLGKRNAVNNFCLSAPGKRAGMCQVPRRLWNDLGEDF